MLTPALPVIIRTPVATKVSRVGSIDLLRGGIMIIMALDHVRDYFHRDAFLYSPTDLSQTNVPLFSPGGSHITVHLRLFSLQASLHICMV
jgi:uncharacterized membrane protein